MRVLCCLDGTNVEQVNKATEMLSTSQPLTIGLIYVTDTGPRHDIEHLRERFLRPPDLRRHERKRCGRPRKRLPKIFWMKGCTTSLAQKRYKGRDDQSAKLLTLQPSGRQTW